MKLAPFRPGRRGEATKSFGLLAERVLQPRDVVQGDPDIARQQRLLHEVVVGGIGINVRHSALNSAHIVSAAGERKVVTTPPVKDG